MKLETKFEVGEKVFVTHKAAKHKEEACEFCAGSGQLIALIGKKKIECPECVKGKIKPFLGWFESVSEEEATIVGTNIDITERYTRIKYFIDNPNKRGKGHDVRDEYQMFKTQLEAQIYCEQKNKQEKANENNNF